MLMNRMLQSMFQEEKIMLRRVAIVLLMLGILSLSVPPAQAARLAGPACAPVSHWVSGHTQTVSITNRCSYTVTAKVRRIGPDGPCWILRPGYRASMTWGRPFAFQGIQWNCA